MYATSTEIERISAILAMGPVRASELEQCSECRLALQVMAKSELVKVKDGIVALNKEKLK
jgi:hypothetical protein